MPLTARGASAGRPEDGSGQTHCQLTEDFEALPAHIVHLNTGEIDLQLGLSPAR